MSITRIWAKHDADGRLLPVRLPKHGEYEIVVPNTVIHLVDENGVARDELVCELTLADGSQVQLEADEQGRVVISPAMLLTGAIDVRVCSVG